MTNAAPTSATASTRRAWFAWALVCLLWGTTYLAIRIGVASWPPALFSGLRFTSAGIVMLGIMTARGTPPPRDWRVLRDQAVVGILLLGIGNYAVVWAERAVPSGIAAVNGSTTPLWTILIASSLPHGRRLPAIALAGFVLGLAGITLLLWPSLAMPASVARSFVVGNVALQIGCVAWAAGTVYGSRLTGAPLPLVGAGIQMLAGGITMIVVGSALGEWHGLAPTADGWWAFTYLFVFGSMLGFGAFAYALEHLPVSTVSLYNYINPVIAVFAGALILHEPLGGRELIATMIVLAAVAIGARAR